MFRVDLHTHPTSHRYYFGPFTRISLDDQDKRKVEQFVYWAVSWGLDAIGITDHHYLAAGLYGREFAERQGLPVQVLPGVELEAKQLDFLRSVHFLAFNLKRDIPKHLGVRETLDAIREQGGVAIMAHPVFCPDEFRRIAGLLDGVEVWNVLSSVGGLGFLQRRLWAEISERFPGLAQFKGSDCHRTRAGFPPAYTEVDAGWFTRLGGRVAAGAHSHTA
jgi:predicted metal-dependent phosphoesterase TrpH